MKLFRLLLIASISICTLPAQIANQHARVPTVEEQMKVLTEKLALSGAQQTKFRPVLQELHDATTKLMEDKSLSPEYRLAEIRPYRYQTRERLRGLLNEDQKKRLDDYLRGPHEEMHGDITGSKPATH